MTTRVLVLGAGFGGLEVATTVARRCGDDVEVTLVDRAEGFVFGFDKLDLLFGRSGHDQVLHRYADMLVPGVRFVPAAVTAIDAATRTVVTDAGTFGADVLVVALGADLHPEATPGLVEGGNEFYTVDGAITAGEALAAFGGGHVVVGVASTPFKCPPAPSETALLLHEYLVRRGLREKSEISVVMPFGAPIPPSPDASHVVLERFEDAGIRWVPERLVRGVDAARGVLDLAGGDAPEELAFDLLLAVPVHRVPSVVAESGMSVDGWVPVDPATLETRFPDVYAVGDVTSVGTPKAGVFAEGQAAVVAARIAARVRGEEATVEYAGSGVCFVELGQGEIAKVDVTFRPGVRPLGALEGPSTALMDDKREFGRSRVARWFGDRPA